MSRILVVVDMQNDFVLGSGVLSSLESEEIIPRVVERVKEAVKEPDTYVLFTQDTHGSNYLETEEGRNLPVAHCIKGTEGHEIIHELKPYLEMERTRVFEKDTFGSRDLAEYVREITGGWESQDDKIEVMGVCTDICVISNVMLLKAFNPNTPISVIESCCAGSTTVAHYSALATMKSCQVDIKM